mmetsp:Transcript_15080/g.42773  ORF Transcript_15080/g.42773 Transcript_15080/m.42773 type:complete len:138 (-) Transcript_15080:210-623(-)
MFACRSQKPTSTILPIWSDHSARLSSNETSLPLSSPAAGAAAAGAAASAAAGAAAPAAAGAAAPAAAEAAAPAAAAPAAGDESGSEVSFDESLALWSDQIGRMVEVGFCDLHANIRALEASKGNLDDAVSRLLHEDN